MKNKQYWINRAKVNDAKMIRSSNKVVKLLRKELIKAKKEIKKELAYFYVNQSENTMHQKYQIESTLRSIDNFLDNLYRNEEEMLNKTLIERYIDIYNSTVNGLGIKSAFGGIDEKAVREIIKTNWSGATFSERIWENRRRLAFTIKQEFTKGLTRGDTIQEISRTISEKLNVSLSDAERLVRTETCWIQNKATADAYTDYGLDEYEYLAYMDNRTSQVCQELDGQIFKLKDFSIGVNAPPMHCYCRSAILPITK